MTQDDDLLLQVSLGNPNVSNAFLCCATLSSVPRIYAVHMPSKFIPSLDGWTTPWDNRLFAFLGDILRDHRHLPTSGFELSTTNVWVWDDDTFDPKLNNIVDATLQAQRECSECGL